MNKNLIKKTSRFHKQKVQVDEKRTKKSFEGICSRKIHSKHPILFGLIFKFYDKEYKLTFKKNGTKLYKAKKIAKTVDKKKDK